MEAGRSLDALIAEKVMGVHRHKFMPDHNDWFCEHCRQHENREIHDLYSFKPYSTSIEAAWEVVENLSRLRLILRSGMLSVTQQKVYSAAFIDSGIIEEDQFIEREETADTAPHAVCLAALKAVEYRKM